MSLGEFFEWMAFDEWRNGDAKRRQAEADEERASLERSGQALAEYRERAGG